ncbi:MAG: hypothetical protein ACJ77A_15645 [Actinomycetota bacterium]
METEISELLQERADDVRVSPDLPAPTLRRARRRRLANSVVAGLTAVVVVAGAVVGLQAALHGTGGQTPVGNGTTAPTPQTSATPPAGVGTVPFPGIWPERNDDELQAEQARADQGRDRYRLDPEQTGIEFAHQALGWDPAMVDAKVQVPPGTSTSADLFIRLHYGTLTREEGLQPRAPYALYVETKQLGRTDADGIWSVVGVSSDLLTETCDLGATGAPDGLGGPPLQVGGSVHVCGTTSWDPSLAQVQVWVVPGDAATSGLAPDEASPVARIAVQPDGSFDGNVGPIPGGYGSSGVVVVEVLDRRGDPAGVLARKVEIVEPSPSPSGSVTASALPAAVEARVATIRAAIASNDIPTLGSLIDPAEFRFGAPGVRPSSGPAARQAVLYWKERWPQGSVLLDALLQLPYATIHGGATYVWPAVATMSPHQLANLRAVAPEWPSALRTVYPDLAAQIQHWVAAGHYTGWRVEITADGRWIAYFEES